MRDKRYLQHHDGLSVIEADELPYFEFIEYKKLLSDDLKQRAKQAEEQQSSFDQNKQNKPKFSLPKLKMPKLRR